MFSERTSPSRAVFQEDALAWLDRTPTIAGASYITSLPDYSEIPFLDLSQWKAWFVSAAARVLRHCPPEGVVIFFQTDIKEQGTWIDKGYLCSQAAEAEGHALLWHKLVCRIPPGQVAFGRPAYSHLLCFSRGVRADIAKSTVDVMTDAGAKTWTRGMGMEVCLAACRFVRSQTTTTTIIDPFCGHGAVLAVANHLGMNAIGVDLGAKRARRARALVVDGGRFRSVSEVGQAR